MLSRFLSQKLTAAAASKMSLQRMSVVSTTTRGFAGRSNINEDQIDSEIKYQRENPDKALYHDKQNLKDRTDFQKTDGQHTQYRSLTNQGSGNADSSEQERLKILHNGEKPIQHSYDQTGTFNDSRVKDYDSKAYHDEIPSKDYFGSGTRTTQNDYKSFTKEDYQNLNARNVGNPTPAQDGKYEQKTGSFGMYSQDAHIPEGARQHSFLQDNWKKDIQEGSGQHDTRTLGNTREHDESVQNTGQRQDYSKKVQTLEQQRAMQDQQKPKQFGGKNITADSVVKGEKPVTQDAGPNTAT